jgi:ATPase subunit of ABC transporter with duplicated ATPase domains
MLAVQFGKRVLFDEVNLKFVKGNCYGVIGANGAGKSTFLKILSGEIESTQATSRSHPANGWPCSARTTLHFDEYRGNGYRNHGPPALYDIMQEKNAIYDNPTRPKRNPCGPQNSKVNLVK